ncbi:hypothetical protein JHJ32_11905 [Parapedobacter sp. ISTM3]|uniref:hypothetical protein n=1 Tax=Parapedobacter sp. ISTM3 TaxID=2800130 RepID=UPI0019035F7F|nr:hypothetical protein [Parapedobacter sp. ISTM3]MBK1440694.1 hypothetical protein [Parapedobacter sp. ISTM3]
MTHYVHRSGFIMRMLAMCMVIAVVGVPLTFAMHTHSHDQGLCGDHDHHEHSSHQSDAQECNLCTFYAHYVPKVTYSGPSFICCAPVVPWRVLPARPLDCGVLCKGLGAVYINKGPPASLIAA